MVQVSQSPARNVIGRSLTFHALDHRFSVIASGRVLANLIENLFGALAGPDEDDADLYELVEREDGSGEVRRNGSVVAVTAVPGELVSYLLGHVNAAARAASQQYLLLHAAAASVDDRAVLVPGRSGAGKSTLVVRLVEQGLTYLTDDTVALDPVQGVIRPFPKPIVLRKGSWAQAPQLAPAAEHARYDFGEWVIDPRRIRPCPPPQAAIPHAIVLPRYEPGRRTRLEELRRSEALLELATTALNGMAHGRATVEALARVARANRCYWLVHGDAGEAATAVADVLIR
jgi:hypothetical protein